MLMGGPFLKLSNDDVLIRVRDFLRRCPKNFDFPMGGEVPIPMPTETELVTPFLDGFEFNPIFAEQVRNGLTWNDAYSLVIFGVRMAVVAVRSETKALLENSLWAVCVDDNDLVDWRDILKALSVINDCAVRIGCDFDAAITRVSASAPPRRQNTIREAYLVRDQKMRSVHAMGLKAVVDSKYGVKYVSSRLEA